MKQPYKKIESATLDVWRNRLLAWTDSEIFRSRVDEFMRSPELRAALFRQGGLTFLRDAWVAARIATALSAKEVRLCTGERPDFELHFDNETRQFEVTEADMPGRRRGEESTEPKLEEDAVEDWRKRFEAIPDSLKAVIEKKLEKQYSADISLVVYLNLGSFGVYRNEGLPILRDCTLAAKDAFKEIMVFWEGTLFRFWKDGRYSFAKWESARLNDA
jgi:hypothetical protein